ncbi:helix-turn-helix domain-containing protein [Pseudonocardia sp. NPDC049154]|uniref:helix-turn-helix domain-containing protein n=1 Tax=Pseudonocardia sp. NPDC049154 TaxID=3155501 RepID=UPI00340BB983
MDYTSGMITIGLPLARVEKVLHERFVSVTERETMADLRRAGVSIRKIADAPGRAPSTVSRELARNSDERGEYRPHAAHRAAATRRARP